MNNDKSVSLGQNSLAGTKLSTMGVTSRQKFENVEKLSTMVRQMQQTSHRSANPQQILEAIKNNIKSSYNRLYDNYEANKNVILKSIQQTETNDANEGTMKQRFQNVLKQKNAYDKLKVEVQGKQKKLKKLMEIRDQVLLNTGAKEQLKDTLADRAEMIKSFEEYRQVLQYEAAVLDDMKKQRQNIKLALKQRHDNMLQQDCIKRERTKKVKDASHTKKVILDHIQQKIKKEDLCQIPLSLSQQLQRKLAQYSGKHTQQQILHHQKIISEQKLRQQKQEFEKEQNIITKIKQAKQNEEKREYQIAYNHYLLKQAEEEQIKKFCRVDSIADIASGVVEDDRCKLEIMARDIQVQIGELEQENKKIKSDIQAVMTTLQQNKKNEGVNLLDLQKQLENEQTQLRRLKAHAAKKQSLTIEWESVLQTMFGGKCDRGTMVDKLKKSLEKYETYSTREHIEGSTMPQTVELKPNLSNQKFRKLSNRGQNNESSQASEAPQF